jgi:tetratricopeptide (TPR) repeat protein
MLSVLRLLLLGLLFAFASQPAWAAKRIALVVGNNLYENFPDFRQLKKAVNDAKAVSQTLQTGLGFDVRLLTDSSYSDMNRAIKQVEADIEPGSVVFLYFSGHGVAIEGANYLMPSDVPQPVVGEEQRLSGASFPAEQIISRFQKKGAKAVFAVLDACRDNPFENEAGKSVGGGGGLTKMDAAEGVFILFAAGVGQTALDRLSEGDSNPNSVFTRNLLPLLETNGLSQVDLAKKLYSKVKKEAATVGHDQHPAYYDQIEGYITLGQGDAIADSEDPEEVVKSDVQVAVAEPKRIEVKPSTLNKADAQKEIDAITGSWQQYQKSGDVKAYVAAGEKALDLANAVFGENSIQVADASNFMIGALTMANDLEGSIRAARNAVRIYEGELGAENPRVANDKGNLAGRLIQAGKLREAEKLYTEALATYDKKSPGNNVYIGMSNDDFVVLAHLYSGMAILRMDQGKPKEALRVSDKSQNIISALSEQNLIDHGWLYANHASILKRTENCDEAKTFYVKAVKAFKAAKVPTSNADHADALKQSKLAC